VKRFKQFLDFTNDKHISALNKQDFVGFVDHVLAEKGKLSNKTIKDHLSPIKSVFECARTRAVVDLETRDVELELSLPEWAISGENAMCLDGSLSRKSDIEAHHSEWQIVLTPKLFWRGGYQGYAASDFGIAA